MQLSISLFLDNNSLELLLWILAAALIMLIAGRFRAGRGALIILYSLTVLLLFFQIGVRGYDDLHTENPSWLFAGVLLLPVLIVYTHRRFSKIQESSGRIVLYGIFIGLSSAIVIYRLIYYGIPNVKWGIIAWNTFQLLATACVSAIFYILFFRFLRGILTWKKILLSGFAAGTISLIYHFLPIIAIYSTANPVLRDSHGLDFFSMTRLFMMRACFFLFPQLATAALSGWFFISRAAK